MLSLYHTTGPGPSWVSNAASFLSSFLYSEPVSIPPTACSPPVLTLKAYHGIPQQHSVLVFFPLIQLFLQDLNTVNVRTDGVGPFALPI